MGTQNLRPYKVIGLRLKKLREDAKESLAEVSEAIEISAETLRQIEQGTKCPDEDVLILLMGHFKVSGQESVKFWELAGYYKDEPKEPLINEDQIKQIMMVIPIDNKFAFTDSATIKSSSQSVLVDFELNIGNLKPQTVSRLGMSLDFAKKFVEDLKSQIALAEYQNKSGRLLPKPQKNNSKSSDSHKKNNS
jgi:transcriptional regulator with XRE-family HTH domain